MELLTATELGKRVGLPEATVRSYHDRYPSLIPAVGTGRSRRYYAEAVAPLGFVAESLRAGMPEAEVHAALVSRFAPAQPSPLLAGAGTPDYLSPDGLRALRAEAVRDALAEPDSPVMATLKVMRSEMVETWRVQAQQEVALRRELSRTREELAAALEALRPARETVAEEHHRVQERAQLLSNTVTALERAQQRAGEQAAVRLAVTRGELERRTPWWRRLRRPWWPSE